MAPKEIDLKQYSSDYLQRHRIYKMVVKGGMSLDSALKVEGLRRSNYMPVATSEPDQPKLIEEAGYNQY